MVEFFRSAQESRSRAADGWMEEDRRAILRVHLSKRISVLRQSLAVLRRSSLGKVARLFEKTENDPAYHLLRIRAREACVCE